jgi:MoxR-like ATPase
VRADDSVLDYLMALVAATRAAPLLRLGVSPRGSLALLRAARARALADGRDFLVPDDLKTLAVPALAHRVLLRTTAGGDVDGETVIAAIADATPVPR